MTDLRFRLFIIALLGVLAVALWTFPTWYPVLNRETVVERFPGLALDAQPEFVALPREVQQAYLELYNGNEEDEIEAKPELALQLVRARLRGQDIQAPEAGEPFEPPSETIVRTGEFIRISPIRGAQGEVTIYQLNDLSRVLRIDGVEVEVDDAQAAVDGDDAAPLFEPFRSTRAPDVHVILTRNPDPLDARGVGIDYIDLGELKGNVGGQTYQIPQGVDFTVYPILALYSVEYDWVISTATLN